jgi:hypothetical protein
MSAPLNASKTSVGPAVRWPRFGWNGRKSLIGLTRRIAQWAEQGVSYQRVLFRTFPPELARRLAAARPAEVIEAAPKPFAEVFAERPLKAARLSIAATILGPTGIAAVVAALISAAVLIDHALLTAPPEPTPPTTQKVK